MLVELDLSNLSSNGVMVPITYEYIVKHDLRLRSLKMQGIQHKTNEST